MNYDTARKNLIEQNIRPWNVFDTDVIKSLYKVQRENFVPSQYKNFAFSDFQIPLSNDESMLNPMVEARILQSAMTKSCGAALEIGCGSGYMAAMLSQIYQSVISIDINQEFVEQARKNIKSNHIKNVQILLGDGLKNDARWSNKKFDVIVISGGIKQSPLFLKDSILPNGKITAIIGSETNMNVVVFKKNYSLGFLESILFETKINHLYHEKSTEPFQF